MNHPVANKIYTAPNIHAGNQDNESILREILTWLNQALMTPRPVKSIGDQHKNFMDANLLDDVMGPEISRTLRR